ncbi:MAG: SH3 domain-containing protein [Anaerolineae bacterium]|nr:SH3 domain-containing protein [Anaerolineae bacterium]
MWKRLKMPGFRSLVALMLLASAGCNLNTPSEGTTQTISGAPVVRIIAPLPNATYREGVSVPIQAQISNAGSDIDRVEVSVDDNIIQTFDAPNTAGAPTFSITHTWAAEGAGTHSIDVLAFRGDGSSSASAAVSVTVVTQAGIETEEPSPTPRPTTDSGGSNQQQQAPTQPPAQSEPTEVPASATPNTPQVTTRQGINVRSGPGTNFNPPIGSLAAGATAPLLGRNPAGDWYKIQYYNAEAWVFAGLVETSGDTSNLPVDAGPPTPAPTAVPPTAVQATAVPQSSANLVAGNWRFDPAGDPACNQTFNIFVDVANLGSTATTTSGSIDVRDYRVSDGQALGSTSGGFPIIQPNQTVNIGPIPFTVSTYYGEQHRIVITINPNGAVPESTTGDNVREIVYTLQKGSCP